MLPKNAESNTKNVLQETTTHPDELNFPDQRRPSPTLPEVDIRHHIDEEEAVFVRANGDVVYDNVQPVPVSPVQPTVPPAPSSGC